MRKGFTLLEVLTVVIIVAILASLAVPQFFRVAERARAAEGVQILGAVRSAQMRVMAENGEGANGNYSTPAVANSLDMSITDAKFFDMDTLVLHPVNETHADNYVVADITRDTASSYAAGQAAYVMHIQKDGTITCDGNATMCDRLGY